MKQITLTISNRITIRPLWRELTNKLKFALTMPNPQWISNNRQGYSNKGVPSHISCFRQGQGWMDIPRGFLDGLMAMAMEMGIKYQINDQRQNLPSLDLKFRGELRSYQQQALYDILSLDFGVICAPTRSGKTVIALAAAAQRNQPFTVVVHTRELLDQWAGTPKKEGAIEKFLGIKPGVVAAGQFDIGKEATVALIQTLYKDPARVAARTGFLILDECHRCPSRIFREAISFFNCRYMLGPSATPYRADGLTNLIHWYIGPQVHEVDRRTLEEQGAILRARVIPRETGFTTDIRMAPPKYSEEYNPNGGYGTYGQIIAALISNDHRNKMIAQDAVRESRNGTCLILTDRTAHARTLTEIIRSLGTPCECLVGDSKDRRETVELLNSGRAKVVAATGALLGEGFDCRALHAAFLAMPLKAGKTEGGGRATRFLQYVGRVLTPAPGKDMAVIYDYVDGGCPALMRAYRTRMREYKELGWEVIKQ